MESEALLEIFFLYLDRDLSLQKGGGSSDMRWRLKCYFNKQACV
ncbi:hypothetical protein LEMLEM_LOCUS4785 [Lemmus lemmus]